MSWNTMKLCVKLTLTIASLLIPVTLVAITGFLQLNRALDIFKTEIAEAVQQEQEVNLLNLTFREQIQDWKDSLLRGKNPEKLKKHWSALKSVRGKATTITNIFTILFF